MDCWRAHYSAALCRLRRRSSNQQIWNSMQKITNRDLYDESWPLNTCYPFVEKDTHTAKRTSAKALVMTHVYSNVVLDKVEEAVKNGVVGNENDDW